MWELYTSYPCAIVVAIRYDFLRISILGIILNTRKQAPAGRTATAATFIINTDEKISITRLLLKAIYLNMEELLWI